MREYKNLKLANELLKLRRRRKLEQDQAISARNIELQSQSNAKAAEAAAAEAALEGIGQALSTVVSSDESTEADIAEEEANAASTLSFLASTVGMGF